jgi:hypothetical protein
MSYLGKQISSFLSRCTWKVYLPAKRAFKDTQRAGVTYFSLPRFILVSLQHPGKLHYKSLSSDSRLLGKSMKSRVCATLEEL